MAFGVPIPKKLSDLIQDSVIGALIATGLTPPRWVLGQSGFDQSIFGETGDAHELSPHQITITGALLQVTAATWDTMVGNLASLVLNNESDTEASLTAKTIQLFAGDSGNRVNRWDEDGYTIGLNGTPIKHLEVVTFSGNTNASGQLVVNHNANQVPITAFIVGANSGATTYKLILNAATSSTVTVRAFNTGTFGAAPSGTTISGALLIVC